MRYEEKGKDCGGGQDDWKGGPNGGTTIYREMERPKGKRTEKLFIIGRSIPWRARTKEGM